MLKQFTLTPIRERVLNSMLSTAEKDEAKTEFGRWQAAVRRIGDLEAERDRTLPEVDAAAEEALRALRKIEPEYKRVCSRLGHAKRRAENTRRDFSYEHTNRVNAAEAAAPEPLRRLRREIADDVDRTRKTQIESVQIHTGLDPKGKPIFDVRTNQAAIAARIDRLRALCEEVDLLKTNQVQDLDVELAKIRKAIPEPHYPIDQ